MKTRSFNRNQIFWVLLVVVILFALSFIIFYMIGLIRYTSESTSKFSFKDIGKVIEVSKKQTTDNQIKDIPQAPPIPTNKPKKIQILFAGDMMFDRHIRLAAEREGYDYLFSQISDLLNQQDLIVANLEGPVTDNSSLSVGSVPGSTNNYIFTFSPEILPALRNNKINTVNIGNNHILNFGSLGYEQTIQYLEQNQIKYFGQIGASIPQEEEQLSLIQEIEGFKLGLVNFNQFSQAGIEEVLEEIANLKSDTDLIIAYTHWGNEYVPNANQAIVNWAHQLIDAGADLVIGSHPHVVQNLEIYQNKRIYYSLGNFIFDQYFQPEVKKGLLVQVKINPETKKMEYKHYQVEMLKTGQTKLLN